MNQKTVCVALVGMGWAGAMHAKAYSHVYGVNVRRKTVCALEENVPEFAAKNDFEGWTHDFEEVLWDPEIDVVDITTPPFLHKDMIMQAMRAGKDASGFVSISDIVQDVILDIRYYSTYNFVGDRIDGYEEPLAFLTREAADALRVVSDEFVAKGYRLRMPCLKRLTRPHLTFSEMLRLSSCAKDARMESILHPFASEFLTAIVSKFPWWCQDCQ